MRGLKEMIEQIRKFLSPVRSIAFMLIVLAFFDHLYNPFLHTGLDNSLPELLARAVFLFCGVYGILGNGKHIQIRATIVGFPFIFLSVIYGMKLVQTGIQTIIIPLIFTTLVGFWTIIFGAYHEYRTRSILNCLSNSNNSKSDN